MMTEEQAKEKWCPAARQVVSIQHRDGSHIAIGSANRDACSDGLGRCIAAACMAWRETSRSNGVASGYCGLAGFPE